MVNKKQNKSKYSGIILIILVITLTFSIFSTFYVGYKIDNISRPIQELSRLEMDNSGKVRLYVPPLPDTEGANIRLTVI